MRRYIKLVLAVGGYRGETKTTFATEAAIDAARRLEHTMMTGKAVTDQQWARIVARVNKAKAKERKAA